VKDAILVARLLAISFFPVVLILAVLRIEFRFLERIGWSVLSGTHSEASRTKTEMIIIGISNCSAFSHKSYHPFPDLRVSISRVTSRAINIAG